MYVLCFYPIYVSVRLHFFNNIETKLSKIEYVSLCFHSWLFFNFRFMICCDRCEEWFHGDCVGISEARGRLLERNGEDYICPNCTILQVQDEPNSETTDQQEARLQPADTDSTDCTSIGTIEQKSSEDQGIKGRIEKAANPSGKKKLKIFQPVSIASWLSDDLTSVDKHQEGGVRFFWNNLGFPRSSTCLIGVGWEESSCDL